METTMYDINSSQDSLKKLKSNMTLDFGTDKKSQNKTLLATPDLQILLSPELERLIVQQNGQVTTTPTPTQFLFPRSVTDEQEAYARGFVDALAELHEKKPGAPEGGNQTGPNGETIVTTEIPSYTTLTTVGSLHHVNEGNSMLVQIPTGSNQQHVLGATTVAQKQFTTMAPLPGANFIPASTSGDVTMEVPPNVSVQMMQSQQQQKQQVRTNSPMMVTNQRLHQLKEEPQTVPCMSESPSPSFSNPVSPIAPINMETQEVIKLDRKRARNRVAARKCRTRKLERISKLEEQVDRLKGENGKLTLSAKQLREQVSNLKRQIMDHVNLGCKVMLSPNLL